MSRGLVNLLLDLTAAALLTAVVATGYLLAFALPPGTNRTHWLWGLLRHEWGTLHASTSLALLAVLTVHVALHWRWLVTGLSRRLGLEAWAGRRPGLAGLALVLAAAVPLVVFAAAAHVSVRPLDTPLHSPADDAGRAAARGGPDVGTPTASAAAVLAARCAACHSARALAGGIRADTPAALAAKQGDVAWIVPGDPDASRLFRVVGVHGAGSPVAPKHRVTQEEWQALRRWIASLPRASTDATTGN